MPGGGYQISNRLKEILFDIHHQAVIGMDTIATTSMEPEERKMVEAAYKKIISLVNDTGIFERERGKGNEQQTKRKTGRNRAC